MMDKTDKFSVLVFVAGLLFITGTIIYLPEVDTHLFNIVSVVGAVSSTTASIIAIIQIVKIKANNDVFIDTMEVMGNNFMIEIISRSIEQVRLIKEYIELKKEKQARPNFGLLKNELIKITYFKIAAEYKPVLDGFINFCTSTETHLYDGSLSSAEELKKTYAKLSELESLLQNINIKAKLKVKQI